MKMETYWILFLYGCLNFSTSSIIRSEEYTNWGTWKNWEYCPTGKFAQGFRIKVEDYQGGDDDTSVNGIELFCGRPGAQGTTSIKSDERSFGRWMSVRSCNNLNLIGFQLRAEKDGGSKVDNTAANDLKGLCENGQWQTGGGLDFGNWQYQRFCGDYKAINGIQVQTQNWQGDKGM